MLLLLNEMCISMNEKNNNKNPTHIYTSSSKREENKNKQNIHPTPL